MKNLLSLLLSAIPGVLMSMQTAFGAEPAILPNPIVVTATASISTTAEGDSKPALFTIHRAGPNTDPVMVFYRVSGTAASGFDYLKLPGSVVIPAGADGVDIEVAALDDKILEQDETVVLTLLSPIRPLGPVGVATVLGYQVGDPSSATITIKDNDLGHVALPTVQIDATTPEASEEGPKSGLFTISRMGDSTAPLTVTYEIVTDSILWPENLFDGGMANSPIFLLSAAENGVDYAKLSGSVTIPAGQASVGITVDPIDDKLVENREHVTLRLTTGAHYNINQPDHATVLLADNDQNVPLPTVRLVTPADGSRLPAGKDVSVVALASVGGGLVKSVEFFADDRSLGIRENSAADMMARLFTLTWKNPPLGEHSLTARATDNAGNSSLSAPIHVTVLQDGATTVSIVAAVPEAIEADSRRPGVFKVTRTGSLKTGLNVRYSVTGTAANGIDYEKLSGIVTIPAGATSAPIRITPYPDKALEGNETVIVTLEQLFFITVPAPEDDYLVVKPDSATVTIVENVPPGLPPKVEITHPKTGEIFAGGTTIRVEIQTTDPDGYVPRMELYDGDKLVDSENRLFFVKPPPGQVEHFAFDWKTSAPGKHSLTAKAIDDFGMSSDSAPVIVVVEDSKGPPVVTITALDGEASEADTKNTATFEVRRTGGTATKLNVRYAIDGSAQNGVDYLRLSSLVTIPAGKESATIVVTPIADKKTEGKEEVVLSLVQLRFFVPPGPEDDYRVGSPGKATAVILDASAHNTPPKIVITSPKDHTEIPEGSDLLVTVEASDSDGIVTEVAFYADGQKIGSLKDRPFNFTWKNVPAGHHFLQAKATDDGGASTSSPKIEIEAERPEAQSFVTRRLPGNYVPGEPLKVVLDAAPLAPVKAYAIEDQPPKGWSVSNISDGGIFDSEHRKVKFGPFLDNKPRTLTYETTPPAKGWGTQKFTGIASANGVDSPITGDQSVVPGSTRHPADNDPADNAINMKELTAYATAWRIGQTWPAGPNPIPQSYVTRAGEIWRRGETYGFDSSAGPAPVWWVPKQRPGLLTTKTPPSAPEPDGTPGKAKRSFISVGTQDQPAFDVAITVSPKPGVEAWTIEERPPADWVVSDIGDEGAFDSATGAIRWGVFFDDQEKTLKYRVTPPAAANRHRSAFEGMASFDGVDVPVHSHSMPNPGLGNFHGKIHGVRSLSHREVEVAFSGEAGHRYTIQVSTDLVNWTDLDSVPSEGGEIQIIDTHAAETPVRYYRTIQTD
jgi:hypothetical protein